MKKSKYIMVAIVSALLTCGAIGVNLNTLGVFLVPVSDGLNVGLGDISVHSTLISMGMALGALAFMKVKERVNFKAILLVAGLTVAGTTLLMSRATAPWQFSVLGFIRGFASAFYGMVPVQMIVNNWFHERHGLVSSLVSSFNGVAGAVFSPILMYAIENYGWRTGYLWQTIIFVGLSLPAILYPFTFHPEDEGYVPYGGEANEVKPSVRQEITEPMIIPKYPVFLLMGMSFLTTALTGLAQHIPGIGENLGHTAALGAAMLSAAMIGNITFKLLIGTLSDWKGQVFATITIMTVTTLGIALLYIGQGTSMLITGSVLYGSVPAMVAVGMALLAKHFFGNQGFNKVFPAINFISNIGGALAISFYGYSVDFTGNYQFALFTSGLFAVLTIVLILLINYYYKQRSTQNPS